VSRRKEEHSEKSFNRESPGYWDLVDEVEREIEEGHIDPEEADELEELKRDPIFKYWEPRWHAEWLLVRRLQNGKRPGPKREEEDRPWDQEKFFNDIEDMQKQIPKKL
jgi:hypothetical protein